MNDAHLVSLAINVFQWCIIHICHQSNHMYIKIIRIKASISFRIIMWTILILAFLPFGVCMEQLNTCKINECGLHLELEKRQKCSSMVRPICNFKSPLVVSLDLLLISIHSIDELNQVFEATIWVHVSWNNCLMK